MMMMCNGYTVKTKEHVWLHPLLREARSFRPKPSLACLFYIVAAAAPGLNLLSNDVIFSACGSSRAVAFWISSSAN